MARRSTPPTPQPAQLTPDQIATGIRRLKKRIVELEQFDPEAVDDSSDPTIEGLQASIETALVSTFGSDTADYHRYSSAAYLHSGSISMFGPTPVHEVRDALRKSKALSITLLKQAISTLEEQQAETGVSPAAKALQAIDGLGLHPKIEKAAGQLYRDGHYANSVESACKALKIMVQLDSGRDDLDGVPLMQAVFSPKSPILAFNDLASTTDRDEQQGLMFLFSGVMAAFRNPRAHDFIEDDPERAIEVIAFVSLLAKLLEKAKRVG